MDARDMVELSLRLPAGELGRLAQLMERVWGLLALEGGGAAGPASAGPPSRAVETGVNTAFDTVRFQRLGWMEAASADESSALEAVRTEALVQDTTSEIPIAAAEMEVGADKANTAGADVRTKLEAAEAVAEVSAELEIPAVEAEVSAGPESPIGSVDAAERRELDTAQTVPVRWEAIPPVPAPAAPEVRREFEEAQGAGFAVEAEPTEAYGGVFAAMEELVSAGPAPLTAESVSLAFQRDDRRYDNGFPLY